MWIIKIMKLKLSNETFLSPTHRGNLNVELERRSQTAAKRKRLQIQHFRYHRKLSTAGRKAAKFILSLGQEWARRKTGKQKLFSEMHYPTKIQWMPGQPLSWSQWGNDLSSKTTEQMSICRYDYARPCIVFKYNKGLCKLKVFGEAQNSSRRVLWLDWCLHSLILQMHVLKT